MSNENNGQTFIFFGNVGSGKGTQVKLLQDFLKGADALDSVYAGTGDGFRKLVEGESFAGGLVRNAMNRGELIPDFFANAIITDMLVSKISPEKHLFFDGYPRTLVQSAALYNMMKFFARGGVNIIFIEVGKAEATKRNLLRARADDTEAGLMKRFEIYEKEVLPAMKYFEEKDGYTIHHIDGEQSVEDVHSAIKKSLGI
jgi:adenylate kinase family enzyme